MSRTCLQADALVTWLPLTLPPCFRLQLKNLPPLQLPLLPVPCTQAYAGAKQPAGSPFRSSGQPAQMQLRLPTS